MNGRRPHPELPMSYILALDQGTTSSRAIVFDQQGQIVAVARKLAVLLHALWKTGEEYEPLGYGPRDRQAA